MTKSSEQLIHQYGHSNALPRRQVVQAGPLSATFESGQLRRIRLGDVEVLRRIYAVVRDQYWATPAGELSRLEIKHQKDSFSISFDCRNASTEVDFSWHGAISGTSDGVIEFVMDGVANRTFLRNRVGICVLNPMDACANAQFECVHADGSVQQGQFPDFVSPTSPVENIRTLSHEVKPGIWATIDVEGDVFEMEDQRNWTDASLKTFSTPSRLPMPVEVPQGTRIRQSVRLSLRGQDQQFSRVQRTARPRRQVITVDIGGPVGAMPRLGLGVASHESPLTESEVKLLRALSIGHIRGDLHLSEPGWREQLIRAADSAAALRCELELAIYVSDKAKPELEALKQALDEMPIAVTRWLVFPAGGGASTFAGILAARRALSTEASGTSFGGGCSGSFAEFNRNFGSLRQLDFLSFAISPQVHLADDDTIAENLAGQTSAARTARALAIDLPLMIGPVTLRPRPHSGRKEAMDSGLPYSVDPRQLSLLGAGWTACSLSRLCQADVKSLTYYETTGWKGVIERESGSSDPDAFPSLPGQAFPIYHVLATYGQMAGGQVLSSRSSDPNLVEVLALRNGEQLAMVVANLTRDEQHVAVDGLSGMVQVNLMADETYQAAATDPEQFGRMAHIGPLSLDNLGITMAPFSVARLYSM